jgi:hypothetical protein
MPTSVKKGSDLSVPSQLLHSFNSDGHDMLVLCACGGHVRLEEDRRMIMLFKFLCNFGIIWLSLILRESSALFWDLNDPRGFGSEMPLISASDAPLVSRKERESHRMPYLQRASLSLRRDE